MPGWPSRCFKVPTPKQVHSSAVLGCWVSPQCCFRWKVLRVKGSYLHHNFPPDVCLRPTTCQGLSSTTLVLPSCMVPTAAIMPSADRVFIMACCAWTSSRVCSAWGFSRMPYDPELNPCRSELPQLSLITGFGVVRDGFIRKFICKPNLSFLKVKGKISCSVLCDHRAQQAWPLSSLTREHSPLP